MSKPLVIPIGPPAVGKMTVGLEIARLTNANEF
jgi:stage III sporulation protein SpoIIIAA